MHSDIHVLSPLLSGGRIFSARTAYLHFERTAKGCKRTSDPRPKFLLLSLEFLNDISNKMDDSEFFRENRTRGTRGDEQFILPQGYANELPQ